MRVRRYIKDDFLQQNSFTKYDKYCPFYKSVELMRNICTFHRLATGERERARDRQGVRQSGQGCCTTGHEQSICYDICYPIVILDIGSESERTGMWHYSP